MENQIPEQNNKNDNYLSRRESKQVESTRRARGRFVKRVVKITLIIIGVAIAFVGGVILLQKGGAGAGAAPTGQAVTGEPAPDFTLPATTGGNITLSSYKGKSNVLIYFNEGLSCDPCIQQIPELEKYLSDFQKMNVTLLSVMMDPVDQLQEAATRYGIKTPMLSYNATSTEVEYDLIPFSMGMGRRAGHTFVLVGTDGIIKWRKDYWGGYGMMVPNGLMSVSGSEIVNQVTQALNLK